LRLGEYVDDAVCLQRVDADCLERLAHAFGVDRILHHTVSDDEIAIRSRDVAHDDDFAVHQFDTGRGGCDTGIETPILTDLRVRDIRRFHLAKCYGDAQRRGTARVTHR